MHAMWGSGHFNSEKVLQIGGLLERESMGQGSYEVCNKSIATPSNNYIININQAVHNSTGIVVHKHRCIGERVTKPEGAEKCFQFLIPCSGRLFQAIEGFA